MFYIERAFKKVEILDDKSENINGLIEKSCEELYSLQNLIKAKDDIFGFEYKDCFLWNDISKEDRILLIAEAGYGKTTELKYRYTQDKERNKFVFWVRNLRLLKSYENLPSNEEKEYFYEWLNSKDKKAVFYIDSLDEYLSKDENILINLVNALTELENKNFSLRISSRPHFIETEQLKLLEGLLGEFKKVKLLPFFEEDIKTFAKEKEIEDIEEFYNNILEKGLLHYAKIPLILEAIINEYLKNKILPANKVAIYYNLIQFTIEKVKYRVKEFSDQDIIETLSKIALFTMFSKRDFICEDGNFSFRNIPLETCQKEKLIKKFLDTPIFEGFLTKNKEETIPCFKFKYKSLAEFLTARYIDKSLKKGKITKKRLNSLISFEEKIKTPYLDLAGWIATLNEDFRNYWIKKDERILSRIDLRFLPYDEKKQIFHLFINIYKDREIFDREILNYDVEFYKNFSNLKDEIKSLIDNKKELGFTVKEFLVRTIWFNKWRKFSKDLINIVKDKNENSHLRTISVLALKDIGNDEDKKELLKLVLNEDLDDEIYEAILTATYPEILTFGDLPKYLKHNKNENLIGIYWVFLNNLKKTLNIEQKKFLIVELWNKIWEKEEYKSHLSKFLSELLKDIIHKSVNPIELEGIFIRLLNEIQNNNYKARNYLGEIIAKNIEFAIYFLIKTLEREKNIKEFFLRIFRTYINNEEVIEDLIKKIKEYPKIRAYLYETLLTLIWVDNKIKFLKQLYELKEYFTELKNIWEKFAKTDLTDTKRVEELKKLYELEIESEKMELERKQKEEKDSKNLLNYLKNLAKSIENTNDVKRFLVDFFHLKEGYLPYLAIKENENGIIKYLGKKYYSLYLAYLEQFINWKNLPEIINFKDLDFQEIILDAWQEFKSGKIKILVSLDTIYTLAYVFSYRNKFEFLEELIEKFGENYKDTILRAFEDQLLQKLNEERMFPYIYLENKNIYEFLSEVFIKVVKNNFSKLTYNDLINSVVPFLIKIKKLESIKDEILKYLELEIGRKNISNQFEANLAIFLYLDFEEAFKLFQLVNNDILGNSEDKKNFIESVFSTFYYIYEYNKKAIIYLEEFSPNWEIKLVDILYKEFPEDVYPNGVVEKIHRITYLKILLREKLILIEDIKVKKFLENKIKENDRNKSMWQSLLKDWVGNYYNKKLTLSYSEIQKIFIDGYYKLETERDFFSLIDEVLDDIIHQIEDNEFGLTRLLSNKDGTRKKEEKLQLLIANLLKYKLKQLKVIPVREIELGDRSKIDITVISGDYKIPIEIKLSNNGNKERGLFTGILNKLVEIYMEDLNYGIYLIGVVYENNKPNISPKEIKTIIGHLKNHIELTDKLIQYAGKSGLKEINDIKTLQEIFEIIKNYIRSKYNKEVIIKFVEIKT